MNNTKYVAFLDILGFKDLIENNKLEVVEELYDKIQKGLMSSFSFTNFQDFQKSKEKKQFTEIEKNVLNSLIISDSIIIWTDDDSLINFLELLLAVKFFMYVSMGSGIPLRGSISCGELVIKHGKHEKSPKFNSFTSILGLGLTRAYIMESKSEWSGCVIDDKCMDLVEIKINEAPKGTINLASLEKYDFIRKYKVPLKSGIIKNFYTVNWTHFNEFRVNANVIKNAFKAHNKNTNDWSVENKLRNTLKYYKDTTKNYFEFLKLFEE